MGRGKNIDRQLCHFYYVSNIQLLSRSVLLCILSDIPIVKNMQCPKERGVKITVLAGIFLTVLHPRGIVLEGGQARGASSKRGRAARGGEQ